MENINVDEFALYAPSIDKLMSPIEALTTRFDLDSSPGPVPAASKNRDLDGSSLLVSGESRQGFRIGELCLMIRYEDASELSEMPDIHRLPNAPDWFYGMANLHGKLIPVLDLARYIGIEPDPDTKRMLLVLSRGNDATGVMIDGLPVRLRIETEKHTDDTLVSLVPEGLVKRSFWIEGHHWMDLNVETLFAQLEQNLIT